MYEIIQTAHGFKVRKPYTYKNGRPDKWLYLESRYKGAEKWALDYLYARTYTRAGAERIIKLLERSERQ